MRALRAAAPVRRAARVEAGRYVEAVLPCRWQHRRSVADRPELARLCAADHLSLENLTMEGWELVALVNLWAWKHAEVTGMSRSICRRGPGRAARGAAGRRLQKDTELRNRVVCPYTLCSVPEAESHTLCCKSCS